MEYLDSLDSSIKKIKIIFAKGTSSYFVNYLPEVGLFPKSSSKTYSKTKLKELVCETC